jgi:uncharacterized membrane-anchored protein
MSDSAAAAARRTLNKVPEIIVSFWIIKVLCTTVGETASDYLTDNVGLGLTKTTVITAAVLGVALVVQFRLDRYVAAAYWTAVVLISIVGTQITDNLTDGHGVPLELTTTIFAVALAATFAGWWLSERTLSIHTIYTRRREGFYWLAVLFTFALGTAAGDLISERFGLGYATAVAIFALAIGAVAVAHYRFALNAVAAFWAAYVLTRPLGASIGDWLSQPKADGGLGLGTTLTTALFLATILAVIAYLTLTRRDVTEPELVADAPITRILLVAHDAPAIGAVLDAVRSHTGRSSARFHLLVHAGHTNLSEPERHRRYLDGEELLTSSLPLLSEAAGRPAEGSVSMRPDAAGAIEETIAGGGYDEVIVAVRPPTVSGGVRVTAVVVR